MRCTDGWRHARCCGRRLEKSAACAPASASYRSVNPGIVMHVDRQVVCSDMARLPQRMLLLASVTQSLIGSAPIREEVAAAILNPKP